MDTHGTLHRCEPHFFCKSIERSCPLWPLQQVRAHRTSGHSGKGLRQQCRLIVSPPQKSRPMQGHRRNDQITLRNVLNRAGHPSGCRFCNLLSVPVLEPENKPLGIVAINQRGPAFDPRARCHQTVITIQVITVILTRQRRAACIANCATNKGCFAPARAAKTEIAVHLPPATQTSWRVNKRNRCLQTKLRHLI